MLGHHEAQQNHLLNALSPAARERLYPHLELVEMPLGKVLLQVWRYPTPRLFSD